MNVLSLFDGMSCGQQALERIGIKVDKYFASEVDKYAIQVTMKNYPNTIQLGDVRNVKESDVEKIDIIIGGSPCQSFSFAGKRKGMSTKDEQQILTLEHYLELKEQEFEFEGQSYLFWEFVRLVKELKPTYFFLENVVMVEQWENVISKTLGVKPIKINSALVSAQNRNRLYWTNIGLQPAGLFGDLESIINQPKDKKILLQDILEYDVDEKYFLSDKIINGFLNHNENHKEKQTNFIWQPRDEKGKASCLRANGALCPTDNTVNYNYNIKGGDFRYDEGFRWRDGGKTGTLCTNSDTYAKIENRIRKLTPVECERLQTVKDNYTQGVSDTQRYRMLGNGWTVDVIAHIFSYLPNKYLKK